MTDWAEGMWSDNDWAEEHAWETRYFAECERLGVEAYKCRADGCDRAQPCRRHKDVPDITVPKG